MFILVINISKGLIYDGIDLFGLSGWICWGCIVSFMKLDLRGC